MVQLVMIESEQIEHGRMQVANLNRILDDFISHIVGFSMADAGSQSTASQPYGEGAWIVITAHILHLLTASIFSHRGAAEFSTPNHERVFEQTTRFKVGEQRRSGLIDFMATVVEAQVQGF